VAVAPDGTRVYVGNEPNTVSVISTATDTVVGSPIIVGLSPVGLAVTPDGRKVYVTANFFPGGPVSVINTGTGTVSTITGIDKPFGVVVSPDGRNVYVTDQTRASVVVIDAATDTIVRTISVGQGPFGVAIAPDGKKVYVTNSGNIFAPGCVSRQHGNQHSHCHDNGRHYSGWHRRHPKTVPKSMWRTNSTIPFQ